MIQHGWMECLIDLTSDLPETTVIEPIVNREAEVMGAVETEFQDEVEHLKKEGRTYSKSSRRRIGVK